MAAACIGSGAVSVGSGAASVGSGALSVDGVASSSLSFSCETVASGRSSGVTTPLSRSCKQIASMNALTNFFAQAQKQPCLLHSEICLSQAKMYTRESLELEASYMCQAFFFTPIGKNFIAV